MNPGHPFHTDELDHLRSKQRYILSALPVTLLQKTLPTAIPKSTLVTLPARAELALRELANRQVGEAQQLIADAHQVAVAESALSVINAAHAAGEKDLADLQHQLERQRQFPKLTELTYNDDVITAMRVMVPLLIWADEIAGDYVEPRISELRPTAR